MRDQLWMLESPKSCQADLFHSISGTRGVIALICAPAGALVDIAFVQESPISILRRRRRVHFARSRATLRTSCLRLVFSAWGLIGVPVLAGSGAYALFLMVIAASQFRSCQGSQHQSAIAIEGLRAC